jgi:hypothetical protein
MALAGRPAVAFAAAMRLPLFASGAAILALGFSALRLLEKEPGMGFFSGALTVGGGLLICAFFTIRMQWHGFIGGGIIALLGAARGLPNLAGLPGYLLGDRSRGPAPLLEAAVALICIALLIHVLRVLQRERIRRLLAQDERGPD